MRNLKVRKLTDEEERQRERLAERLKGKENREPCVESEWPPFCNDDIVERESMNCSDCACERLFQPCEACQNSRNK